jgi:hypothetical protein
MTLPLRSLALIVGVTALLTSLSAPLAQPTLAAPAPATLAVAAHEGGVRLTLTLPAIPEPGERWEVAGHPTTTDPATGLPLLLAPIRLPEAVTPTLSLARAGSTAATAWGVPPDAPAHPAAQVERLLIAREEGLAVIALAPLAWDGAQLTSAGQLVVDVRFVTNARVQAAETGIEPLPELSALLDAAALNRLPAQASRQFAPPQAAVATPQQSTIPDLLLTVTEPGVVQLTGAQLAAAGWPLDAILMSSVQLEHQGERLPYATTTSVIDNLAADTVISFTVSPGWSRYSDTIGFRLTVDATAQELTAPVVTTTPFTFGPYARYASVQRGPAIDGRRGDFFYVGGLSTSAPTMTIPFTLPQAVAAGSVVELGLQGEVLGESYQLAAQLDGQTATSVAWTQRLADQIALITTTQELAAGPHTLALTYGSGAAILVDRGRVQAIRQPLPTLTPSIRLAPAKAADPAQANVDLLILTHAAFMPALPPLIAYHQRQGRSVAVIDVQTAYDAFGDGTLDPEAIRQYLAAHTPKAVLLVGDATWDFKNHLGFAARTFIPPYLERVDAKLGEASCDTCYVRWSSASPNADFLPDALIGRLSVETLAEAQTVVQKLVRYATAPPTGGWRGTMLAISDNSFERDGTPDKTASPGHPTFEESAQRAAALLPTNARTQFFSFDPRPASQGQPGRYGDVRVMRREMFAAWNAGAGIVLYTGHANYNQWAVTDAEAGLPWISSYRDAGEFANGARLPLLVGMTCLSGLFQDPTRPTIDEGMFRSARGGTIGALSSSGLGVATGHDYLQNGLIPALTATGAARVTFGQAQLAGFTTLLTTGGCCTDLVYSYQLLGDPYLQLPAGGAQSEVRLPLVGA